MSAVDIADFGHAMKFNGHVRRVPTAGAACRLTEGDIAALRREWRPGIHALRDCGRSWPEGWPREWRGLLDEQYGKLYP